MSQREYVEIIIIIIIIIFIEGAQLAKAVFSGALMGLPEGLNLGAQQVLAENTLPPL